MSLTPYHEIGSPECHTTVGVRPYRCVCGAPAKWHVPNFDPKRFELCDRCLLEATLAGEFA